MFGIHNLALFIVAGLMLNITPGPDTLYVVGRSTTQGRLAGVAGALGVATGCLMHTTAAAIGLSALLMASAGAFMTIKLVGAAYLVYLGIDMVRKAGKVRGNVEPRLQPAGLRRVYVQGCLTNALNPKVALFFLAFLPQFVSPEAPSKALAFIALGTIFNLTGTAWNIAVALFSARIVRSIGRHGSLVSWFNRCVGGIFIYIGVRLVFVRP